MIWTYQHAGAVPRSVLGTHCPLVGRTGTVVLRWWSCRQNQTQQNPQERLHIAGEKRGWSPGWQQAIAEALIHSWSLLVCTCWCAAPFIKIQIRPTKQVLLQKQLASCTQILEKSTDCTFSSYLAGSGTGACLQLPAIPLPWWGTNREKTKANLKHRSYLGLPFWTKAQAACPFPSLGFVWTMQIHVCVCCNRTLE